MISDPKTIPETRYGRILFSGFVALLAAYFQFYLYQPAGLLYALTLGCLLMLLMHWGKKIAGKMRGNNAFLPPKSMATLFFRLTSYSP